jgi:hypothetical protein
MALKDTVREYLEMLDSPGYSSGHRDELLAKLADEVRYATPQLTQKEIAANITHVDNEE